MTISEEPVKFTVIFPLRPPQYCPNHLNSVLYGIDRNKLWVVNENIVPNVSLRLQSKLMPLYNTI